MKQKIFILLVGLMFILTACGGGPVTLNVEMKEFVFMPNTFTVPAGAPVTLNLKNTGSLEHELVILILNKDATLPFDEDDQPNIYWEAELGARQETSLQFTAPSEPGTYHIVCGTAGHLEQGMRATLIVKP